MKLKTGDIVYGTDFKREDITVNTRTKNSLKDIIRMSVCAVCVVYFSRLLGFIDGANEGAKVAKETMEKYILQTQQKKRSKYRSLLFYVQWT